MHWMEEVLGYSETNRRTAHDDTIIILLDPDMIILRPIVNDFSRYEVWRKRTSYPLVHKITHGFPMAAEYGFGNWWYRKITNFSTVLPANELPSPAQSMTNEQVNQNYSSGPPYMVTARDFFKIASKWRQIAWRVQKQFPDSILSEMFAYSWAAVHLNMPHQQGHSFMVSDHWEEGFKLFLRNHTITSEKMCLGPINHYYKPHILHYCQRYGIGKYMISKYELPHTFVGNADVSKTCKSPLLAVPPTNVSQMFDYYIDPNDHKRYPMEADKWNRFTQQEHLDRMTFMACELIGALNRAATYFKKQHCNEDANYDEVLIFHDSLDITPEEYNNVAKPPGD